MTRFEKVTAKTAQPFELRELARTRVEYEGGRFLVDAVLRLDGNARDRIVAWAIETGRPEVFEPNTWHGFIAKLVRALHAEGVQ